MRAWRSVCGLCVMVSFMSSCVTPGMVQVVPEVSDATIVKVTPSGTPLARSTVSVHSVVTGSAADTAGIRQGDVILTIDGQTVIDHNHALSLIRNRQKAHFVISRNGTTESYPVEWPGVLGVRLVSTAPSGAQSFKGSGSSFDVMVNHPDYNSFTHKVEPAYTLSEAQRTAMVGRTIGMMALGGLMMILGNIGIQGYEKEQENPTGYNGTVSSTASLGLVFGILSTSFGASLLILSPVMAAVRPVGTWNTKSTVTSSSFNSHAIFDSSGYNRKTGVDRWGVTSDGRFPDGSRWDGAVVQGKKEGPGMFITADGTRAYVGTYSNNTLNGLASIHSVLNNAPAAIISVGQFTNDIPSGSFIEFDSSGKPAFLIQYLSGNPQNRVPYPPAPVSQNTDMLWLGSQIIAGKASGDGVAVNMSTGEKWEGNFENGQIRRGTRYFPNGRVERGEFTNGQLTRGLAVNPDGTGGEGTWRNGVIVSPGKLFFIDRSVYEGDFNSSNVPHGEGVIIWANGDNYTGTWRNGVPEGRGRYNFGSGTTYTGEFVAGQFQGKGIIVKTNGESFDGEFYQGQPHGMGIHKFGNSIERAEYYEGRRIDQLYLIRQEREKDRIERARQEEIAQERRRQEEANLLAAQKRQEEAERARQAEANRKRNFAVVLGASTGLLGSSMGMNPLEAVSVGVSTYSDVVNNTMGTSQSSLQKTVDTIVTNRTGSSGSTQYGDSGQFNERPSTGTVASSGGSVAGQWRNSKGDVVNLGSGGSFSYSQTRSVNGNPGSLTSTGSYTWNSSTRQITYTISETRLSGSAGYDEAKTYNPPRSFTTTMYVENGVLVFENERFTK